jgi:hypothetical protein
MHIASSKNMNSKRCAMVIAAMAFIGFAALESVHRFSCSVSESHEITLVLWRREN